MPANMLSASAPMIVSVLAAFLDFGERDAGAPLLIASTPVSAVQPLAKARSTSTSVNRRPTRAVRCTCCAAVDAPGNVPLMPLIAATDEHHIGERHEKIRRDAERAARFAHVAQVRGEQQEDEPDGQRHRVDCNRGKAR